jgi:hypothetical protein
MVINITRKRLVLRVFKLTLLADGAEFGLPCVAQLIIGWRKRLLRRGKNLSKLQDAPEMVYSAWLYVGI